MLHTLFFSLQNAVYFIMLPSLVPVLFTFYIQGVLKFKCKTPVPKGKGKGKSKAIPIQAWTGPEGSRRLRLPDFKTIGTCKVVSFSGLHTGRLYPMKYSWYSFLFEFESTPGPIVRPEGLYQ
jgi:hypothetical protein